MTATAQPYCVRKGAAAPCGRCTECRIAAKDPRVAALFGMPPPAVVVAAPKAKAAQVVLPCVHRGETTGESVVCQPCGDVRLKLFACALFGDCTVAKPVEGHACCKGCDRRAES